MPLPLSNQRNTTVSTEASGDFCHVEFLHGLNVKAPQTIN
jgi:hypothetical protein